MPPLHLPTFHASLCSPGAACSLRNAPVELHDAAPGLAQSLALAPAELLPAEPIPGVHRGAGSRLRRYRPDALRIDEATEIPQIVI